MDETKSVQETTQPQETLPYGEAPKGGDLDEWIFYGMEWQHSER